MDPRVVLVKGYMVESRFHNPICNSGILWITLIELPSSPHDWFIMTLHTYIQSWKFAYLFSSSEEKIKFTCQKVRCVSSNNNRKEQKKIPFSTTAAHRFIDNACGVSTFDQFIFESASHYSIWNQNLTTSKFHKANSYLGCSQFFRVPQKRFNVKYNP